MDDSLDIGADGDPAGRQAPGATLESMLRVLVEALEAVGHEVQGAADPAPARAMAQVPCSNTPKPCAS